MRKEGIIDLIAELQTFEVENDKKTLENLKQVKLAIDNKKRNLWPSKTMRKIYNQLEDLQKKYFYDILCDMIEALVEYCDVDGEYNGE